MQIHALLTKEEEQQSLLRARASQLSMGLPAVASQRGTHWGAGKSHPLSNVREGSIQSSVHLHFFTCTDYKNSVGLSLMLTLYAFTSVVLLVYMKWQDYR